MLSRIAEVLDDALIGANVPLRARLAPHIPQWVVPTIQRDKFRRLLRYVSERSPFYRRRFKESGIDIRGVSVPADLGDFFTTAQDLRDHPIEEFLCGRPELGFETTGSTLTASKRVYFSRREAADFGRDGAIGLYNLGLRPEDRVVDAFDYSFWNAPFTLRAALDRLGCFHVTAAKIPPAEFYDRVKGYGFNVMFVEPSWLVVLTEIARVRGTWPVKFIYTGGENMSEATRRYVEAEWKTSVYMGYGQTETFGPCTCLLRAARRLAKIRGRTDEMVNCGMGNLGPWFFEQLLDDLPEITRDWQVGVIRTGNHDTIEFRLELRDPSASDAVVGAIEQRVRKRIPDSWRNYELKLFEFAFRFAAPGALRTGRKLRRLVDERMRVWE
jgi:phenylacetate-coenzyme A ligase PaaK-like adenylate-forming protein